MAKILLTYEFGAGLGHINRLAAVGRLLAPRHRLVFAVPELARGRRALQAALGPSTEVVDCFLWRPFPREKVDGVPLDTFADTISSRFGYEQHDRLLTASLHWLGLLARCSPDLIVGDFAPTLRLVSQSRIPSVIVGSGYTVPPAGRLLPPMRPWVTAVPAASRAREGQLMAAVNAVREKLAEPMVDFFADLFHGERTFVCTLPELDPYRGARREPPIRPFNVPAHIADPEREPRNAVFCYLPREHPALDAVLAALKELEQASEIYVRGADPQQIATRCSRRTRVRLRPANLAMTLPASRILLHHGGLGTTYAGLAAGVPQILLPLYLEQHVTARGLNRFGCCRYFDSRVGAAALKSAIEEMTADPKYLSAAMAAKRALAVQAARDPAAAVAEACEALL